MSKRLELKLDEELFDSLEVYRIKNKFEDKQDALREILKKELFKKTFFQKIKELF